MNIAFKSVAVVLVGLAIILGVTVAAGMPFGIFMN